MLTPTEEPAKELFKQTAEEDLIAETQDTYIEFVETPFLDEAVEEPVMPTYDITLSQELQRYTWDLCMQYEISYELILSLMYRESHFNTYAVNTNKNKSKDEGICQLNNQFSKTLASRANIGVDEFNPFNAYQNIKTCIVHFNGLRETWKCKGVTAEEDLFYMTLGSYNRGVNGLIDYHSQTGTWVTDYAEAIARFKEMLETEGVLHD
jgi:membrane-bound lytic murein transglycosylase MltF